ncbi:hypothetical protein ACMU_18520 [Actibacterium mucosum KCTC 23349]|uniref:Uncharacterized protein n=1 Tax=Actibacterium mucosum KCTC 23349 TaxID=1454373 RepID=A0A037ZFR1_9RHOB|nr:hypothetical protein [Actibacterium mucosum]KAJ54423.1 hypothetical protein ACMU_18520 [Actibacterium mucosum KCTC 23349]
MRQLFLSTVFAGVSVALSPMAHAAEGERVRVTGEIIDTWCYFSGVMGGPDAVVGSAHHTCALWCSAGGIPVGLLGEDGEVYMVLKIGADDGSASGDTQLTLASHEIVADGLLYQRDGLNYIVVEEVVADNDITNLNHEDYGPVPPFAIPNPNK